MKCSHHRVYHLIFNVQVDEKHVQNLVLACFVCKNPVIISASEQTEVGGHT